MKKIFFIFLAHYLYAIENNYTIIIKDISTESNITINEKSMDTNISKIIINRQHSELNNTIIESKIIIKNSILIGHTGVYIGK